MTGPDELTEPDRRALRIEIVVVLAVTFGLSAYTAILELVEAILLNLSAQIVALNPRLSPFDLINLGLHLARVAQLVAWGALGVYLLWRSGFGPERIGLDESEHVVAHAIDEDEVVREQADLQRWRESAARATTLER